jgi:3-keto-5-aminohexanoate cleavage enzyme
MICHYIKGGKQMEKLIISVATTGSLPTKAQTPYVPVTPAEITQDAYDCYNAGASIVHIHARDKDQKPSHDFDFFAATLAGIKNKCNIITQISTGGRAGQTYESRAKGLALDFEMASLNTGSVNFPNSAYVNEPALIEYLAKIMLERGIKPEVECFDVSFIYNASDLAKQGLIKTPLHFNFVMGLKGALPFSLKNYVHLMESIPVGSTWTVSGVGKAQLDLLAPSIITGGHVRVGLEDNIYYSKGVLATNVQLVERAVRLAKELGREVATPDEARKILNLK